jgi:hypothetical protein
VPPTRRRGAIPRSLALLGALVAAAWLALGLVARPTDQSCDPTIARDICVETIDAALRKGLPAVHSLLLAAHVEPGPAARPDQFGHRATVTFSLLGVPGTAPVRMFFDAGGHWGGIADRQAPELAAWAVGWATAIGIGATVAAAGVRRLARRSRGSR